MIFADTVVTISDAGGSAIAVAIGAAARYVYKYLNDNRTDRNTYADKALELASSTARAITAGEASLDELRRAIERDGIKTGDEKP